MKPPSLNNPNAGAIGVDVSRANEYEARLILMFGIRAQRRAATRMLKRMKRYTPPNARGAA